jgi:hypothetical protein
MDISIIFLTAYANDEFIKPFVLGKFSKADILSEGI